MSANTAESSQKRGQMSAHIAEVSQCNTESNVTQRSVNVTERSVNVTQRPVNVTASPVNVTQSPVNVTASLVYTANPVYTAVRSQTVGILDDYP